MVRHDSEGVQPGAESLVDPEAGEEEDLLTEGLDPETATEWDHEAAGEQ